MRSPIFIAVRRNSTSQLHKGWGRKADSSLLACVTAFSVVGLLTGCLASAMPADRAVLTLVKLLFISSLPAIAALAGLVFESRE